MEDHITCDCGRRRTGWQGKPPVPVDGDNWPLDFAAKTLGVSEKDLRDLVRIVGLEPTGTMTWATFRRSGRTPRVYNASKLIKLHTAVQKLSATL